MKVPTKEEIIRQEAWATMKTWPWLKIILITFCLFYFTFFGRIAWGADQDYVGSTWQMDFAQQMNHAWEMFQEDIDRDFTDMGIVRAQINLEKRIDFILSQHEIEIEERRKINHQKWSEAQGIYEDSIGDNH